MFNFTTYVPDGAYDNRSTVDKEKDYTLDELVASTADVPWIEKKESEWNTYPVLDQKRTSSCVAHTLAKMMGIYFKRQEGEYIDISRTHLYQRRVNKPEGGMVGADAFKIAQEGVTLAALAPNKPTDAEMDAYEIAEYKQGIGAFFAISNYIALPTRDFETVASTIYKTGKGVMVWFYGEKDEWSKFVPEIRYPKLNPSDAYIRHSVTAVDFTLYKGKKCLVIEDSAHFGGLSRRLITEDFFKARNFYAAYFMNFKYDEVKKKPKYKGTIASMQDCLKHYGVFPSNVDSTGNWFNVTQKAVEDFCGWEQIKPVPKNKMNTAFETRLKTLYP
jgi:hypothetical protein